MLINAAPSEAVSGYKSDRLDATRLADLGAQGLLRPRFIPSPAIRELRELMRNRKALVEDRTREVNRAAKLLESASIKLSTVFSDVFGPPGGRDDERAYRRQARRRHLGAPGRGLAA